MKNITLIIFGATLTIVCILLATCCRNIQDLSAVTIVDPKVRLTDDFSQMDSLEVYATNYYNACFVKQTFQGKGYRKAWQMPIKVPVVFLDSIDGGLIPLEKGGGKQTLSMDLIGQSENIYTLRSVNKNPSGLVPKWAKALHISNIVTDGISAQHPYGALPATYLADKLDILNSSPKLIFVPHQEALDSFNAEYGGQLFFLEYEPEGKGYWVNRPNVIQIEDTEGAQKLLTKYSNIKADEAALLRARLFDIVIGDWDRHAKQWGWVMRQQDSTYLLEPMVTDRDNAFYNVGGVIPWIVTRPAFTPFLRPHRKNIDYFQGLIKDFDTYFLYDTPVEHFIEAAKKLQNDLSDEMIEEAFETWPKNFRAQDADIIIERIKSRRDNLLQYANQFRESLDEKGPLTEPIKGSDKLYNQPAKQVEIYN